jgi:hypothetical protein
MKTERVIGRAETLPETVVFHRLGAEHAFFCRLHDQHQRAFPIVLSRHHLPCGADEARNVHVMAAGVHHGNDIARDRILLCCFRGIRQSGFFLDRQAVHVGAHHDQGPRTVFQDRDHAGAADVFGDGKACGTQLLCHAGRGLVLDQ